MTKTDFYNKLISFNRKFTSNKTNYLEVEKKRKIPARKDNKFFWGGIYFKSKDRSQNKFVYEPTIDMLELKKKANALMMFLVGN